MGYPRFKEIPRDSPRHEQAVQRLRDGIASGHLRVGDRLPSERELGEQLGVSRTIVREAIRVLAAQGVLAVRQGRRAVVTATVGTPVRVFPRQLTLAEQYTLVDLMEARQVLEVALIGLAAERATEEAIQRIGAALEAMREGPGSLTFSSGHATFHLAIAEAARNPVLLRVYEPIMELLGQTPALTPHDAPLLPIGYESHVRLFRAVRDHRPAAARTAMSEHLTDTLLRYPELPDAPHNPQGRG